MRIKVILFILILLVIPSVNAGNTNLEIFKDSFTAGDTVPLKLTFAEKPLSPSYNINLIDDRNQKIKIGVINTQLSDTEYYAYFDLPKNLERGSYKIRISGALFMENNQLVEEVEEEVINVENINPAYGWLEKQDTTNSIIGNSLSILALKNTGLDVDSNWLINQQDATGCFPKGDCNTKDTAFALLALNSLKEDITKTINWVEGAQNIINKGSWNLIIQSNENENGSCSINTDTINIINGIGEKSLNLPSEEEITLNVNCSKLIGNVEISVKHVYLGYVYNYFTTQNKVNNIIITNNGCFGQSYKTACDYESTMYVIYALKTIGKSNGGSLEWLKNNYNEADTIQHAFLVLLDNFEYSKNWLINNQKDGVWSKRSVIYNDPNNIYTTAWTMSALKDTEYIEEAKIWISQQEQESNWGDIIDTSTVLYLVFPEEKVTPALSFNPGVIATHIKNQPPVSVTFTNNGYETLTLNFKENRVISLSQSSLSLAPRASIDIQISFVLELMKEEDKLEFTANNKSYILPLVQTEFNISSFVASPIKFVNDENIAVSEDFVAKFSLTTTQTKEGVINFRNFGDIDLTDIKLKLTGDLDEIISINLIEFDEININQTKAVPIIINEKKIPLKKSYSGSLLLMTKEGYSIALPIEITITDYTTTIIPPTELPEQKQIGNRTAQGGGEGEKSSLVFWIIFIIILLGIAGLVLYKKFKKKKLPKIEKPSFFKKQPDEFQEAIKKAEKEYKGFKP